MYFEKKEVVSIDGVKYEVPNSCMTDHFACKEMLSDIYLLFDQDALSQDRTAENYTSWKKDLVKKLKEWDKAYLKH